MKNRFYRLILLALMFAGKTSVFAGGPSETKPMTSPWKEDWFPNVILTNQDGKAMRFYEDLIKGKVVAINFIFTSCPQSCPMETAKLLEVQKELGARVGREIFMYSISIDPETDTVPVLKKYMQKFRVGPGWQFLTGKKSEIDLIRTKLGLLSKKSAQEKLSDHSLSFVVGNEVTGQWIKKSAMDHPMVIARLLRDDLQNFREAPAGTNDYQEAPKLVGISAGEQIFRTRCLSCHTVGRGDLIGPDLLGVSQKRERAWLLKWLKVPDQMLTEKDATAIELFKRYKEVPMPNLGLTNSDAEAVLQYIDLASQKVK